MLSKEEFKGQNNLKRIQLAFSNIIYQHFFQAMIKSWIMHLIKLVSLIFSIRITIHIKYLLFAVNDRVIEDGPGKYSKRISDDYI